jgi:hypothetical protein
MFRSNRRPVIFPQAEHARLAAAIAAAWGNPPFERPNMNYESFIRGVALHDRGYGELDDDSLGEVAAARWVDIQRLGFAPRGDDPTVDLVVALHVHRLVSQSRHPVEPAVVLEMEAALPRLRDAAGVAEADARAANAITFLCDRISFAVCFESRSEWVQPVIPRAGSEPIKMSFTFDGAGRATLSPWPLVVAPFSAVIAAYRADTYPRVLEPEVTLLRMEPR